MITYWEHTWYVDRNHHTELYHVFWFVWLYLGVSLQIGITMVGTPHKLGYHPHNSYDTTTIVKCIHLRRWNCTSKCIHHFYIFRPRGSQVVPPKFSGPKKWWRWGLGLSKEWCCQEAWALGWGNHESWGKKQETTMDTWGKKIGNCGGVFTMKTRDKRQQKLGFGRRDRWL